MGPIEEFLDITAEDIQLWFGLSETPDIAEGTLWNVLIVTSEQLADQYCNNEFLNDDEEVEIPTAVKTGVMQTIADLQNSQKQAADEDYTSGVVFKKKMGDALKEYAKPSEMMKDVSGLSELAMHILCIYRITPF